MFHFAESEVYIGIAAITLILIFTLIKPPELYEIDIQVFKTQRT